MKDQAIRQLAGDLREAFKDPGSRMSLEQWLSANSGSIGVEIRDRHGNSVGWWEGTLSRAEAEAIYNEATQ